MQTNKINGLATLALLEGREPGPRVGLGKGGTLNHKLEGAAVELGYHWVFHNNVKEGGEAVDRCIELLEIQESGGHMLGEVWTDSHAPIYLRAMTSMRLWQLRIRKARGPIPGVVKLTSLLEDWFEYHYSSCKLGYVPRGPLAGRVLLPCNRKSSHEKLGVAGGVDLKQADDMVRRVWFSLVSTGKPGRAGREFFDLSKDRPDTMAGPITKMVLAEGGFGMNLKRGRLPRLVAPCVALRYSVGHYIQFPGGLPEMDAWSAPSCWVEYDSGRFSFAGEPSPIFSDKPERFELVGPV